MKGPLDAHEAATRSAKNPLGQWQEIKTLRGHQQRVRRGVHADVFHAQIPRKAYVEQLLGGRGAGRRASGVVVGPGGIHIELKCQQWVKLHHLERRAHQVFAQRLGHPGLLQELLHVGLPVGRYRLNVRLAGVLYRRPQFVHGPLPLTGKGRIGEVWEHAASSQHAYGALLIKEPHQGESGTGHQVLLWQ
jgi:hypothetical protein